MTSSVPTVTLGLATTGVVVARPSVEEEQGQNGGQLLRAFTCMHATDADQVEGVTYCGILVERLPQLAGLTLSCVVVARWLPVVQDVGSSGDGLHSSSTRSKRS